MEHLDEEDEEQRDMGGGWSCMERRNTVRMRIRKANGEMNERAKIVLSGNEEEKTKR